jgi:hypothetical protein
MSRELAYRCWLPLLGLPMELWTNSRALSRALDAERPLGDWGRLPAELVEAIPALRVDLLAGPPDDVIGGLSLFRHGPLALVGGGPVLMAEAERGYGLACVPAEPLNTALAALWELGLLLARARGRTPVRAAALACGGRAVLLAGEDLGPLVAACAARGMRALAREVAHLSDGAGGPRVWGDGSGGDLLCCAGPAALCLVERAAGHSSQILRVGPDAAGELGEAAAAVGAAYRLRAGGDLAMAAALVEHVAGA